MSNYTNPVLQALASISPKLKSLGFDLGADLDDIRDELSSGNLGIESDAWDVDAVASPGGNFAQDADTTAGLNFGYLGGRVQWGASIITTNAGTITLSASTTNYVEVDSSGTVSKNTGGFTSGRKPLFVITTGSSSIAVVTSFKTLLMGFALAGITGNLLSQSAATKELAKNLGAVDATAVFIWRMPCAGTISKITMTNSAGIATDNTNYKTFGVVNKGAGGSGTTVIVDGTAAANSTKSTGGSAITAYVGRDLTLTSTGGDLVVAAGDVVVLTITKNGSATALADAEARLDLTFTN